MIIRRFVKFMDGLIEPARIRDTRERHLSRTLNIMLLILLLWGLGFEIQSRLSNKILNAGDLFVSITVGILALAYYLNHRGEFRVATVLTLGLFIISTFTIALFQHL